jgi:hypothetical protein
VGTWRLKIQHDRNAGVNFLHGHGATGFKRYLIALIAEQLQQWNAIRLRQRLTTGNRYQLAMEILYFRQNFLKAADTAAFECISSIAILATQRASCQSDKNRGSTDRTGLTLKGMEYLGDTKGWRWVHWHFLSKG